MNYPSRTIPSTLLMLIGLFVACTVMLAARIGTNGHRHRELSKSTAINAGQVLPQNWPDPLRDADRDAPDIGAVPHGLAAWVVGVDGRLSVFGGDR